MIAKRLTWILIAVDIDGLDWPVPGPEELENARSAVRRRLEDDGAASLALARFYDPEGKYGGRTFLDLEPSDPSDITTADLLSVTMLNVAASPLGVRRLLACGTPDDRDRRGVLAALQKVSATVDITADLPKNVAAFEAAAVFYTQVKAALGNNPWVVASKLCASKRAALIPVRDRVVVRELGLANQDFRSDWLVFRYLLEDADVLLGLHQAASRATAEHGTDLSRIPALRLLDTVIWMMRPQPSRGRFMSATRQDSVGLVSPKLGAPTPAAR